MTVTSARAGSIKLSGTRHNIMNYRSRLRSTWLELAWSMISLTEDHSIRGELCAPPRSVGVRGDGAAVTDLEHREIMLVNVALVVDVGSDEVLRRAACGNDRHGRAAGAADEDRQGRKIDPAVWVEVS